MATLFDLTYFATQTSYEALKNLNASNVPPGWTLRASTEPSDSIFANSEKTDTLTKLIKGGDYQCYVFQNDITGEYVFANRGTVPGLVGNLKADAAIAAASLGIQSDSDYELASKGFAKLVFEKIIEDDPLRGNIYTTGHSLGYAGAQQQLGVLNKLAIDAGLEPPQAVGFNGAGVAKGVEGSNGNHAINIPVAGDRVDNQGIQTGATLEMDGLGSTSSYVLGGLAGLKLFTNPIAGFFVGGFVGGTGVNHAGTNVMAFVQKYPAIGAMDVDALNAMTAADKTALLKVDALSWLMMGSDDKAKVLANPTQAVSDLQANGITASSVENLGGGQTRYTYASGFSYVHSAQAGVSDTYVFNAGSDNSVTMRVYLNGTYDYAFKDGSTATVFTDGSSVLTRLEADVRVATYLNSTGGLDKTVFIYSNGARVTQFPPSDDGSQLELKTEGGKTFVRSLVPNEDGGIDRSEWAELKASQPELTPAAYQQLIYSDMAGFLSALRTGDKLNQALYGVKLTLDVMLSQGKTLDQSMAGLRNGLDAVAGAVGVVASLHALQSDDTLTQLNGAVGLLSSSNQLFAAMNGGAIGEGLTKNGFLDKGDLAALQVVASLIALSNLKNLDNMIDNGQVGSAGATVYQAVKAVQFFAAAAETGSFAEAAATTAADPMTMVIVIVVAWALDEILAEDAPAPPPKPPAGWAEFKLVNDNLSWKFHDKMADGQALGYADTVMGKTILNEKMSKLLGTLKTQLEQANRGNTDTDRELVVVASRIPKVYLQSWIVGAGETNGKDNYHFLLESTHAQTGEKTYQPIARQDIDKDFSYSQSCAFTRRRTHKQNRHHTTQGAQHA